jgi:hypothetical protein
MSTEVTYQMEHLFFTSFLLSLAHETLKVKKYNTVKMNHRVKLLKLLGIKTLSITKSSHVDPGFEKLLGIDEYF